MISPPNQTVPQSIDPKIVSRVTTAALMLLNTDQVEQHVIELIKGAQDPAQGIAQAFVFVLRTLHGKSKAMPMQALGQAGQPILQEILKLSQAAKVITITPEFLQQVGQAVKTALSQGPMQMRQQPFRRPSPTAARAAVQPATDEMLANRQMAQGFHKAMPLRPTRGLT